MTKYTRLTMQEREQIGLLLAKGFTFQAIAKDLNRSASSIGREVFRNTRAGEYRGFSAHQKARKRQRYSHRRTVKIMADFNLCSLIHAKLKSRWSPQQISRWLKKEHAMEVSHETIYQYIYVQTKGELKKELISYLRQRKPRRKSRKLEKDKRGTIPDLISIDQRPKEVEDRNIPGHWEGDLIVGKDHKSALGTLVERSTRYVLIVKLKDRDAKSVRKAFAKKIKELPESLKKTLTYDRGKEMSEHKKFTMDTKMKVYFCDPHSPWQRGTNENTNGLIRDFFPKGTDFNEISAQKIKFVQEALNERPRETLNDMTPKERLNSLILNHANFALRT